MAIDEWGISDLSDIELAKALRNVLACKEARDTMIRESLARILIAQRNPKMGRYPNEEVHSIHCPAYTTPALQERGQRPGLCNCKMTDDADEIQQALQDGD